MSGVKPRERRRSARLTLVCAARSGIGYNRSKDARRAVTAQNFLDRIVDLTLAGKGNTAVDLLATTIKALWRAFEVSFHFKCAVYQMTIFLAFAWALPVQWA